MALDTTSLPETRTPDLEALSIKVFADGADTRAIVDLLQNPLIQGITTNPTLMRKIGVSDYEAFARELLEAVPQLPVSLEVFSDEFDEMERQALKIAGWGENVYVKIPVTNTRSEDAGPLLTRLAGAGVKVNVTALMTLEQVRHTSECLAEAPAGYVSVFAGRVADTGRDPVPLMAAAVEAMKPYPNLELIWASPRELLNIFQADAIGCHVITVTHDVLAKLGGVGRDLDDYSLGTVQMFFDDARAAGYSL
ncbi:MAG: transaldolase [Actinobacteria bacterium]|nr:transaldolase [Actinomycetota bacterium]